MAKTLTIDAVAAADTAGALRALGTALRQLRADLDGAAAGGAHARTALQSLPGAVRAAAGPLQTALNPALGALGGLVRGAADGAGRLAALLGGQGTAAKTAARAVKSVGTAAPATALILGKPSQL